MDITNEQWNRIGPIIKKITPTKDPRGRPQRDPRDVLNGILWIMRTGSPWKDLPQRYPPYQTCHRRFQQWVRQGVFKRIAKELAEDLYERGKNDSTSSQRTKETQNPGWTKTETLSAKMESGKVLCLASKFQTDCRSIRISCRKLPRDGITWLFNNSTSFILRWLQIINYYKFTMSKCTHN